MCTEFKLHRTVLPKAIEIGECWARDGLQNETKVIPTADKVEMITRSVDMGITVMEATSFAHPKILPQFADAEEVLKGIQRLTLMESSSFNSRSEITLTFEVDTDIDAALLVRGQPFLVSQVSPGQAGCARGRMTGLE